MNEFEKTMQIKVDINSKDSIKEAIDLYHNQIREVVRFNHEFPIEFVNIDGSRLSGRQINNEEILRNYIYYIKVLMWSRNIESYTEHLSEEIFFAIALEYGFKDKVIEVAKTIVAMTNGSDHFTLSYVSQYRPFGFGVLYLLSLSYPAESYLLTSYMGSSWDDEHCDNIRILIMERIWNLDFSREAIKAFAYCDYYYLRQDINTIPYYKKVYWHPDFNEYHYDKDDFQEDDFIKVKYLWQHFKENPSDYEYFIDILKTRVDEINFDYNRRGDSIYEIFENIIPSSFRNSLEGEDEYLEANNEKLLTYSIRGKSIADEIKSLKELKKVFETYENYLDYFTFSPITLDKLRQYLIDRVEVTSFDPIKKFQDFNRFLNSFRDYSENRLNDSLNPRLLDLLFHIGQEFITSILLLIDIKYYEYLSETIREEHKGDIAKIEKFRAELGVDKIGAWVDKVEAGDTYLKYLLISLVYNHSFSEYQLDGIKGLFNRFGKDTLHDNFVGRHMDLKKLIDTIN